MDHGRSDYYQAYFWCITCGKRKDNYHNVQYCDSCLRVNCPRVSPPLTKNYGVTKSLESAEQSQNYGVIKSPEAKV
jgi:hypothetical protein